MYSTTNNDETFEILIRSEFDGEDVIPRATNLARNYLQGHCTISDRGMILLCCAILKQEKIICNIS